MLSGTVSKKFLTLLLSLPGSGCIFKVRKNQTKLISLNSYKNLLLDIAQDL